MKMNDSNSYTLACVASILLLLLVTGCSSQQVIAEGPQNQLSDKELAEGWILLFDGESLFGWKSNSEVDWKVNEGVISATAGDMGILSTTTQFGDFHLKVDFRAAKGTNAGVFLRTPSKPTDPATDCYELNIAPLDNPFPTGSFVKRKKVSIGESEDWQTYDIVAEGGKFTVQLDGKQVLDLDDPTPLKRGFIGLQFNQGKIEYRNVKLKPLGLKSIFNGKNLDGWKVVAEPDKDKSEWTVNAEGAINVKNGPGALESAGQYADFVLQADVISNGKHLNSGIFFRCIPSEYNNGYESQIHNGFKDGDRNTPLDFGTGGFYRRQKARKVVADDNQWFHKTLIVCDDHMATWVNGYQVSDWTDTRKADNNPRKGLRLEAGTLQIQGHDPTTDLSFKNLKIVEIPERK